MKSTHIKKVNRLRRLAYILDDAVAIPGTKYRIGLDPILGVVPGGGDTITGVMGAYIIFEAARMGIPRKIIGRMVGNILLDAIAGIVPVIGDLFDVGWKANVKNILLLEKHLQVNREKQKTDYLFLVGLALLLAAIVLGFALITILLIGWLRALIT